MDLFDEVYNIIFGSECLDITFAAAQTQAVLDRRGLDDWTVEPGAETPSRPCASLAFDAPTKTIKIIPIPDAGG